MKKWILPLAALVAIAFGIYYFSKDPVRAEGTKPLEYTVRKGPFRLSVKATGELQAKNSKKISGPTSMQQVDIYQTTIENLVAEGTVVKKGDFIASLNRTELANRMKDVSTEIDKVMTQLEQARIDTAIELRGLRDQIVNLEFSRKEKELLEQQSRYEPEMVIRQARMELERTDRDLEQTLEKLKLKEQQAKARMDEITTSLRQQQNRMQQLQDVAQEFTILAPEDGMVIYARSWNGKITSGSQINAWDPTIAELPDLSNMITKSYINEVDINKVRVGLDAMIKVDALPDRSYKGRVIQVANVGEELRGFDSKVFEVLIQIEEVDSLMRPAMTTGTEIFVDDYQDVIAIPIEGLMVDSFSYVFVGRGGGTVRQEVIPGISGDAEVVIDYGLEDGDRILLSAPQDGDKLEAVRIDPAKKEEILALQETERKKRQERYAEKERATKNMTPPDLKAEDGGPVRIIIN